MTGQTAIFVPGHGVPETILSIRFTPKPDPIGQNDSTRASPPQTSATVDVWRGDFYGDPTRERLTAFSTFDRAETVFTIGEMPIVSPGTSAVAVVQNAPSGFELEFQSEFADRQANIVRRTVTSDEFGTAHETLCELKSFASSESVALHSNHDVGRPWHLARSLARRVGRLATSMSNALKGVRTATDLAERSAPPC